jgi:iron complex outermembrane recepter protein
MRTNEPRLLNFVVLALAGLWLASLGSSAGAQSSTPQSPSTAPPAAAQTGASVPNPGPAAATATDDSLDAIVVTGTSIRGTAPVGSNVVTVDRTQIDETSAQTVQQILRTVPSVTGSGATPQGGNPGNSFYAPTIHGIGSSSSNATLVLVDGHRISPGSQQQQLTDPNMIPPIALERVEVLAEGASSTYGSDAVAGVINFITRKDYDGFLGTLQTGYGADYKTSDAGALWGTKWDSGSVMLAFNFSDRSSLAYSARDYLDRNHTSAGGTNFGDFFCSPASIQPAGSKQIYVSPTSTLPIANTAANSPCQNVPTGDILPHEIRQNAMLKIRHEINSDLDVGLDVVYSHVTNTQQTSRGTLTTTVYDSGPQANPFYVNPPGVTATSQTVRFDADQLLGPGGAQSFDNANDYYVAGNFEYRLGGDFRITGLAVEGGEQSYVGNFGELCGSCANLALNGTTNGAGNLTLPSIAGTNTAVTQLPLTPANALDVWNPVGSNRTSAAVLALLTNNVTDSRWYYSMSQARVGVDGSLLNLPGGPLKVAGGVEYVHYGLDIDKTYPNNGGPSTLDSQTFALDLDRDVQSAFAELLIPVIGDNNALPGVRKLEVGVSGRYDDYKDLATTFNPHFSVGWDIAQDVKVRANYSTSFVAPQLTSVGDQALGGLTSFSSYAVSNQSLLVPLSSFPLAAKIPGATCNTTTCTISSGINGVSVNGGPVHPEPGKGKTWSVGTDFTPSFLPNFSTSVTFFTTDLINQISGVSASNTINSRALNSNLQFYPNGATPAQIAAGTFGFPPTTAIPSQVYYILSVRQENVLNLWVQGIDADANYKFPTDRAGTYRAGVAVTYFTKFDQSIAGSPRFSVLNTTGFNNTFPSIQTQGRGNLGWDFGPVSSDFFVNFVGGYRNWSSTSVNPLISAGGIPSGGGDSVAAMITCDLHVAYNLSDRLAGSQVYVDVTNLFDRPPSFYNSTYGYDSYAGNVLGRVTTIGVRGKF